MKNRTTTNCGSQKSLLFTLLFFFSMQVLSAQPFVTTWEVLDGHKTIHFPGVGTNYQLDWEEVGNPANHATITGNGYEIIDFPSGGTYKISVSPGSGSFTQLKMNVAPAFYQERLLSIEQWGSIPWSSMDKAFYSCNNLVYNATDVPDLSNVTDMNSMFFWCQEFNGDLSGWNTSNVTDLSWMFYNAHRFNGNISTWNTANVTDMRYMFYHARDFNQDIGGWNTAKVTDMEAMFYTADNFNQDIGNWNTAQVTNMFAMFTWAQSFNQNLGNWQLNPDVNMGSMLSASGMSRDNYDQTLIGWNANPATPNGRSFNAFPARYCQAEPARNNLINVKGWSITDGGPVYCCVPPSFSACPNDPITVNTAPDQCNAVVTYTIPIAGYPAPTLNYTFSGATVGSGSGTGSGATFNKGNTTVTITASNDCGTPTCVFTVTVNDATKPGITCPANATITANAGCSGTVGAYTPVSVSDNCTANPTVTQSPASNTVLSGHNDFETVTLTADDGNGNTQACSFTVTLKDQTKPSITCPANTTITANASCSGALGAYTPVSVSDNCAANPTVTQNPASGTVLTGHNDSKTVTLTANDGNGNTQACTFTVTLKDQTLPSITCPANATITANAGCSGALGAYAPTSVSDNCTANPTVNQSPASGTVLTGHNDSETVTLTADDGNGNTQACTFTVTLKDQTKPSITCPGNIIVAANASCSGTLGSWAPASVSDNCTANPTVTQNPVASTVLNGHNDSKTVTLTADDGNGNTQACSFTVTLKDQTKPSITCPANTTITANASCSGTVGAYTPVSVSDNCAANPAVTQSPAYNTVLSGHNDFETVTLTADDGNGNTQACSFIVTLKDQTRPSITCPTNATITANAGCSGTLGAYAASSVSDNCSANPTVTQNPASGTVLNGHNDSEIVTLTADDGNGNTQACTFTVTLKDLAKPNITCPANAIIAANASCAGVVGTQVPVAVSDNCAANPAITQSPAPGTAFSGLNDTKTVTLTADDGNGNTQACSFTVTLKDLTGPNLTCKPATVNLNAAGTGSITTASVYQSGSDNCGTVNLVSVTPSSFNCSNLGANTATLTANDGNGNNGTCTATVTVVDAIAPTLLCKNVTLSLNTSGQATLTVSQVNNNSYDNCSIASFSLSQSTFTCANIGSNNVTLTGKDNSNNTGQCAAVVTVADPIVPLAKCKNHIANLGANGSVMVDPASVNNGSSDNCSFSLSLTPNVFNCSQQGLNTVTLKATDAGGNTATCTANVTVRDIAGPVAKCKNPTIYLDDTGHATLSAAQVDNGSWDNCGMGAMSINRTAFDCYHISGTQTVTLSMTDVNGNAASCLSNVTVKDNMAPTAICEDVTVALGSNGTAVVYGAELASYSYDNCAVYSYSPIARVYTAANLGANNLSIKVKDLSGNTGTCVSVVTVVPAGNGNLQHPGDNGESGNHGFSEFILYPNPSSGEVTMTFQLPSEQLFSLQIFDLAGRMMYSYEALGVKGENTMPMDLNELISGVYVISFQSDSWSVQKRLVLQH